MIRDAVEGKPQPQKDQTSELTVHLERAAAEAARDQDRTVTAQITRAAVRILLARSPNWPPPIPLDLTQDQKRGFAQAAAHQVLRAAGPEPDAIRLVAHLLTITEIDIREATRNGRDPRWFDRRSMAIAEENIGIGTWLNPNAMNLLGTMEMATHLVDDRIHRMLIERNLAPKEPYPEPEPREGTWEHQWQTFRQNSSMTPLQLAKALAAPHVDHQLAPAATRIHTPRIEDEPPAAESHQEHRARLYEQVANHLIEDRIRPAAEALDAERTALEIQETAIALEGLARWPSARPALTRPAAGPVRWDTPSGTRYHALAGSDTGYVNQHSMRSACHKTLQAFYKLTATGDTASAAKPHKKSEIENSPETLAAGEIHFSIMAALSEIGDRSRPEAVARWLAHADWCMDQLERQQKGD